MILMNGAPLPDDGQPHTISEILSGRLSGSPTLGKIIGSESKALIVLLNHLSPNERQLLERSPHRIIDLEDDLLKKIIELGFDESAPFKDLNTGTIKKYFQIVCKRLFIEGKIRKIFSPHSIRHYAAVKHWQQNHDIILLKKFLNHQSISTTQIYLSSLNLEV